MKLPHRRQFLQLAAGGCRAASHLAHRAGASLSDADRIAGFSHLISLRKFAELSNRESGFDRLCSTFRLRPLPQDARRIELAAELFDYIDKLVELRAESTDLGMMREFLGKIEQLGDVAFRDRRDVPF
jgi:hypothetical protein